MSEVYAFGVLMYEISTGEKPGPGDLVEMERTRICGEYSKLMDRCFSDRILLRPTMKEILDELIDIEFRWAFREPTMEP